MAPGPIEAIYDYPSPKGDPRIRKVRRAGKWLRPYSWVALGDGTMGWRIGIKDCQLEWSFRALYNLPIVLTALGFEEPVHLTEGEKDADAVQAFIDATTSVGVATSHWQGADAFEYGQAAWFTRYDSFSPVIVVCDNDVPGAYSGWTRYSVLLRAGVAADRLSVVAPPWDRRRLKDAHDALSVGVSLDDFRQVNLRSLERTALAYRANRRVRYAKPLATAGVQ